MTLFVNVRAVKFHPANISLFQASIQASKPWATSLPLERGRCCPTVFSIGNRWYVVFFDSNLNFLLLFALYPSFRLLFLKRFIVFVCTFTLIFPSCNLL
ncbi:hypothetical protein ANCCAN_22591 [Ancylostoma caninum]|uniref:Uncharacterized protein n=1 Tax=Ancylostoma caninum TaxID=29170 RepID=A0A368FN61_ANCCA|nr:hypothetical protein ANCCAN_22591 [Ancylostoma caninum]